MRSEELQVRRPRLGADDREMPCTRCRRPVRLSVYARPGMDGDPVYGRGLYAECSSCSEVVSSSLAGLALASPAGRSFRRRHTRLQILRTTPPDAQTRPIVVRVRDVTGADAVDVAFAPDSLRILSTQPQPR